MNHLGHLLRRSQNSLLATVALTGTFALFAAPQAHSQDRTFFGQQSSDWGTPGNWSGSTLPTSTGNAWLNEGRTATVSSSIADAPASIRVGTDALGGTLVIQSGGNLTSGSISVGRANNSVARQGTITQTGGTFTISQGLTAGGLFLGQSDVNVNNTGSSQGTLNLYAGTLLINGSVTLGSAAGTTGSGIVNIFGGGASVSINTEVVNPTRTNAGRFLVHQGSDSSVNWDFQGGNSLSTIEAEFDWRLTSGNTYTIDFANFVGAVGDYSITLFSGKHAGSVADINSFQFLNTDHVSNYSVSIVDIAGANASRNLVLGFTATAIPEPSTYALALFSAGALLVGGRLRRRQS